MNFIYFFTYLLAYKFCWTTMTKKKKCLGYKVIDMINE